MSIREIKTQNHDEWVQLRKKSIGGSDAGAIAGYNPYMAAHSLWAEKSGHVTGFEGNLTTEVGSYLEAFVADLFTRETGKKVRRRNATVYNDDYPWAHANVDRVIIGENALLEVKTTNSPPNLKMFRKGEYPPAWYCQVMHYMAVCGYRKAYIAVLIECKDFKVFEVDWDEEEARELMDLEQRFWQHVLDGTPPPVSGLKCDSETLLSMHPESVPGKIQLWGREYIFDELKRLGEEKKALEQQEEALKQQIKLDLGDYDTGLCGPYKVTWKTQVRNTFDRKRFEKENPGLNLAGYFNESKTRVFKVTEA